MYYTKKNFMLRTLLVIFLLHAFVPQVHSTRIKDVGEMVGLGEVQLSGFGLVMGLKSSGDGPRTSFTTKAVVNMLRNMGVEVPQRDVRTRNVAAVMVTATLPAFAKMGTRIDISVSSMGDARSLQGGTLMLTPLSAADGKIYALAQGALSLGGYGASTSSGQSSVNKNHLLAGVIPSGAVIQREIIWQRLNTDTIHFALHSPDFSSITALSKAVNEKFGTPVVRILDAASVKVGIPDSFKGKELEFVAMFESVKFDPDVPSRVVLNEKTGTIVAGGEVSISPVAVTHGSLTISVEGQTTNQQQTVPLGRGRAATQTTTQQTENLDVKEEKADMRVLPNITSVNDLAKALNSLGVGPRDIITIFQTIKQAGALHAELIVM